MERTKWTMIDFECPACGELFEELVKTDAPQKCPKCDTPSPQAKRLYSFPKSGTWQVK